jgi:ABC-type amino acid transport substrate-binding protein
MVKSKALAWLLTAISLFILPFLSNAVAQERDKLDSIKSSGILRVGVAESVPFQFKDPKTGGWVGFNADLAKELADTLEVKLQMVDASWATLIPGLMADQYDIVMVDMFATPKRASTVVFSNPYFYVGYQVFVPADSAATKWEDLDEPDTTFAQVSGTFDEQLAKQIFPAAKINSLITDNNNTMFMSVANHSADAAMMTAPGIQMFIAQNPDVKIKVLQPDRMVNSQGNAYAISPGNYHFLNMLNTWISYDEHNGTFDRLKEKWFVDYPKGSILK